MIVSVLVSSNFSYRYRHRYRWIPFLLIGIGIGMGEFVFFLLVSVSASVKMSISVSVKWKFPYQSITTSIGRSVCSSVYLAILLFAICYLLFAILSFCYFAILSSGSELLGVVMLVCQSLENFDIFLHQGFVSHFNIQSNSFVSQK